MSSSCSVWVRAGARRWKADVSDDRTAVEQLLEVSKPGALHVVLHYLYFPLRKAAEEAAAELRLLGFARRTSLVQTA